MMEINPSLIQRFGKTYQNQDIIFSEFEPGDTFYLIQSGKVEIVKIIGDIEKTIDVLEPGEIFGEMAILEDVPRSATAVALGRVQALEFNRENFQTLMQGNPQIALKLLKLFTKRIYDQVADVFLMLTEKETAHLTDQETVELHATIDDIAHWAGIPPAKCKSVIDHFIGQGRVELFQDRIIIKNINDFVRFVNSKRKKLGED
jgi:CRP/FNR family cyclic AMP-dependent transcriptional regulator